MEIVFDSVWMSYICSIWKNCPLLTASVNPSPFPLSQMGGRRMGRVFSDMWKRCTTAWGQLCLSAPEWLVPHHARTLLPQCEAREHSALRGTPLSHRVGCLWVEPGLKMSFNFLQTQRCNILRLPNACMCMTSVYGRKYTVMTKLCHLANFLLKSQIVTVATTLACYNTRHMPPTAGRYRMTWALWDSYKYSSGSGAT